MADVITRSVCEKCGVEYTPSRDNYGSRHRWVDRRYVAVEALLSEPAMQAFLAEMHARGWLTSVRTRNDWDAGIAAALASLGARYVPERGQETPNA
ncbi:MAG TPA: hypothetical protein VFT50_11565 [Baekduia sp.]|nr:hypothetical protein [Baekduia sp.]